jgi:tRNA (Thr-GGU) A37 N-methylase
MRGVFATRYPARPNQIGFSVVRLISPIANILQVEGVDMLDGTPLLDIKPFVPEFDIRTDTRAGWYEHKD